MTNVNEISILRHPEEPQRGVSKDAPRQSWRAVSLAVASACLALSTAQAQAQTRPPRPLAPDGAGNSQSSLQSAGTPRAPLDPAAAAAQTTGQGFPGIPPATPPIYARLPSPLCADFRPEPNGGWSALGPIQFPGPQGPVRMVIGQTVVPGDYLDGMDLASLLDRDCRRTPPPTGS